MSVEISGLAEVEGTIREILGTVQMERISDKALLSASSVFVAELKSQMASFEDTGASIEEITASEPYTKDGVRNIKVHWKGPKDRYRIIHLNEYGTVHRPKPKGKGAIARALQVSEGAYRQAIEDEIRRSL